ncbi:MAG: beta-ketoacyl-ACP synthase III [bacterium]
MTHRARILGTGIGLPERIMTNHDLAQIVDTNDEWIRERTGVIERRVSDSETASSDLAFIAATQAMERSGTPPEEIDAVLVATITPDHIFPATACLLQDRLNAKNALAFDLSAACTGFLYGLSVAQAYIESGRYRRVLVVGVDTLTKTVDWGDRATCVLFGDGAGAAVLGPDPEKGVLHTVLGADGHYSDLIIQNAGGSRIPMSREAIDSGQHYIRVKGREVYRHAVTVMTSVALDCLSQCGLAKDDIRWLIPHQANLRIIEGVSQRLEVPMDRFIVNVQRYANTSAATIPIALHEALVDGRISDNDYVLMVSFGSGLTWGASVARF